MGSFAMCDLNHDKKIDRKELKYIIQVKMAAGGKPVSDDDADNLVGVFFSAADTDHVCLLLLLLICKCFIHYCYLFMCVCTCVLSRVKQSRSAKWLELLQSPRGLLACSDVSDIHPSFMHLSLFIQHEPLQAPSKRNNVCCLGLSQ